MPKKEKPIPAPPYQETILVPPEQKETVKTALSSTTRFLSSTSEPLYASREKGGEHALLPINSPSSRTGWLRRTKDFSKSQKKKLAAFNPGVPIEEQQFYRQNQLPEINPRRIPENSWQAPALAIAAQATSYSYNLDPTLMMCMPAIAIAVLLLQRGIKMRQRWTSTDLKDASQWGLNLAGAAAGFHLMSNIAETQLGMTAFNDFVTAAAIHGKLVLEEGLGQLALLAGQASLGAAGFAGGLMAIHFITSVFRAGLEKAYQGYQQNQHRRSTEPEVNVWDAFAKGMKQAFFDYFSKENAHLCLVTFTSVMMSFTAKLIVSGLVASGLLTAGIAPIATIAGAILLTALVNYGVINRWGRPKTEVQKIKGFFDSPSSQDDPFLSDTENTEDDDIAPLLGPDSSQ